MEWADRVWRAEVKTVLVNNINKKRPRGRPKQRWLNIVKRDTMDLRLEWKKLVLAAKDVDGL